MDDFNITINKNIDTPIYKQIIEQITIMVSEGTLKPGDRLPTERELAERKNLARGTINKAYVELERNRVLETVQGRGTFVSREQDVLKDGRKENAVRVIDDAVANLKDLEFTNREISALLSIRLAKTEKNFEKVRIAAVDCNPEALSIFNRQLSYISNMDFSKFLLDDISTYNHPRDIFEEFDIILTTSTHYSKLCGMLPKLKDRIMQAAVSPDRQTIIDLAVVPADATIGILCTSVRFLGIITDTLKSFEIGGNNICHLLGEEASDTEKIAEFLHKVDTLIIPSDSVYEKDIKLSDVINEFNTKDKRLVRFNYQIERGSLIYIEEQISSVLNKK